MNLYRRIKGKTPPKDKIRGKLMTVLSAVCLVVTASGVVENEYLKIAIDIVMVLSGGKAFYHAQKVLK